jgi:predicted RNase H-like HicB family nuclease
MEQKFTVILEWDEEAKMFIVSVPSLPGCFTQGNNRQEALERIREAIDGHLRALKAIAQPLPEDHIEIAEVLVAVA